MELLKGLTILIGKDPQGDRLMIEFPIDGKPQSVAVASYSRVPNTVSRCLGKGVAHASLTIDAAGRSMTLANLKEQNHTYVNDVEIVTKRIAATDRIGLGPDRYPVRIADVLAAAEAEIMKGSVSILHLEKVWDKYETTIEEIAAKAQERGRKRLIPIILGSFAGIMAPILSQAVGTVSLFFTIPVAIVSFVFYLTIYKEKDTSVADRKEANNELIKNYVCPNEQCHRYLGAQNYKVLRQWPKCPYCGKKFIEK